MLLFFIYEIYVKLNTLLCLFLFKIVLLLEKIVKISYKI